MTATEMLVSSRLMKTDDSPQEAVKKEQKPGGWTNRKIQKNVTTTFKQQQENQEHSWAVYLIAPTPLFVPNCFSTVISGLAPSTLLPPYHAHTPPLLFHSHTLSHSGSSPLEVYGNGPQLLLESEACLKSEVKEGRGKKWGGWRTRAKERRESWPE